MHALEIEGWMTLEELDWLANQARQAKVIIEIGIWKGRSTAALAEHTPGVVFAIDHFRGSPAELDDQQREARQSGFIRGEALAGLQRYFECGKLFIIERDARDAVDILGAVLRHGRADMLFIDGSHEKNDVILDIREYRLLLKPEGLLCGHDSSAAGVRKALASCGVNWKRGPVEIWFAHEA